MISDRKEKLLASFAVLESLEKKELILNILSKSKVYTQALLEFSAQSQREDFRPWLVSPPLILYNAEEIIRQPGVL